MTYKLDLHTHSMASPDGGLTAEDYKQAISAGSLNFVAVTDHNSTGFARELRQHLGNCIIVGEEASTSDGHLIGLFLNHDIEPGLTASETADLIHAQNGLVYVPHPFEKLTRQGIPMKILEAMADKVDVIEIHNGRALSGRAGRAALKWARKHGKAVASSSDTHGWRGWTHSYSTIIAKPEIGNLVALLANPELAKGTVGPAGRLYPKYNRFRKRARRG